MAALTHRPFSTALEKPEPVIIKQRRTDPESGLRLVEQLRQAPLPTDPPSTARLTPDPLEPEPVAGKKKKTGNKAPWTPERRAKFMATIAKQGKKVRGKKKSNRRAPLATQIRHPESRGSSSLTTLLNQLIEAAEEIKRRLG